MALEAAAYQSLLYENTPGTNRAGEATGKYYHRYGMFLPKNHTEVKLCCFCSSFTFCDKTVLIKAQTLLMACRVAVNCI